MEGHHHQLGRTVTMGVVLGVEAGSEELGAGRVVDDVVVTGVLAAVLGEVLALGVGSGFNSRGCLVRGWEVFDVYPLRALRPRQPSRVGLRRRLVLALGSALAALMDPPSRARRLACP
jgi:hypothetical protein